MHDFRLLTPCHVGEFVREEIINPHGLSITRAAEVLGVTRPALSNFLNEKSNLSPEMAIRLQKAFGVSFQTLMRMQTSYDIARAAQNADDIIVKQFKAA
ncbi:MAG: HigA family addiction module antitoxin [Pseudomonadota bacterium]